MAARLSSELTPAALARWQLARDDEGVRPRARLLSGLKRKKMRGSALAFLRGSAPLFYQVLKLHPDLDCGPGHAGVIVGDAHVENFGVYRAEVPQRFVFNVNDFDDACLGLQRWDVLRLLTSSLLGATDLGLPAHSRLSAAAALLDSYVRALSGVRSASREPASVRRLLDRARTRGQATLLKSRCRMTTAGPRLEAPGRYLPLSPRENRDVRRAFEAYLATLPQPPAHPERFEILDVAFRVAGTGSLGGFRAAVLTRGKGPRAPWLFDLKEEGLPAATPLRPSPRRGAQRVIDAMTLCSRTPPRLLGVASLRTMSLLVRWLAPQEDKLSAAECEPADWGKLMAYLGGLLGMAHLRSKNGRRQRWTSREEGAVLESAVRLAGVHFAAHLAFCQLTFS